MNVTSAASAARCAAAYGQKLGKPEGRAAPRTPKNTFDHAKAGDANSASKTTEVDDPFHPKTSDGTTKGSHVDVRA